MEQNVARLSLFEQLWAWFETNKKQAAWGAIALAIVAFFVAFYVWRRGETEVQAGEAFSKTAATLVTEGRGQAGSADAYLKVAAEYPKTSAAGRAILQAGAALFREQKYAESQAQFQRFTREYPDNPFLPQALLGIASCLEAEGKTAEAIQAYEGLVKRFPNSNVAPQAEFALANIYESQGRPEQAWALFEKLARQMGLNSSIGSEAGIRAEELKDKLPATVTTPPPAASPASPESLLNTILATNKPATTNSP